MSAKRTMYNEDKANAVFAVKIRKLFEENGKTHNSLAEFIEQRTGESVTRQAVGQWCNGNTCPNLRIVPIIAEFFEVSTDYLLTDTEIKTADIERKAVCEYTGLSEEAVQKIQSILRDTYGFSPYEATTFSNFIESEFFIDLFNALVDYYISNFTINNIRHLIPALNQIMHSDFENDFKIEFIKTFSDYFDLDIRVLSLEDPPVQDDTYDLICDQILNKLPHIFVKEKQNDLLLDEYKASKALISIIENFRCDESEFSENSENLIEIFKKNSEEKNKNISKEFIEFVTGVLKGID